MKVDALYLFDTPDGKKALVELFDGRGQLMVYHFMLGSGWEAGCPGCSFLSDHLGGMLPHLNHHDVTLVAIARAAGGDHGVQDTHGLAPSWVSSFSHDYRVSFSPEELASGAVDYNYTATPREEAYDELPGMSAFYKDEAGNVFHTYSTYARGGGAGRHGRHVAAA